MPATGDSRLQREEGGANRLDLKVAGASFSIYATDGTLLLKVDHFQALPRFSRRACCPPHHKAQGKDSLRPMQRQGCLQETLRACQGSLRSQAARLGTGRVAAPPMMARLARPRAPVRRHAV